jgi:hypothetical protein
LQHEASHQQPQQQWVEQLPAPQQQQQQQQRVTAPYGRCVVIYKKGDDLRQDQFILQVRLLGNTRLKCQGGRIRLIGVSGLSNPGVCRPVHFSKSSRSPGMHCTTRGGCSPDRVHCRAWYTPGLYQGGTSHMISNLQVRLWGTTP